MNPEKFDDDLEDLIFPTPMSAAQHVALRQQQARLHELQERHHALVAERDTLAWRKNIRHRRRRRTIRAIFHGVIAVAFFAALGLSLYAVLAYIVQLAADLATNGVAH